jgi:hypothetical protein
MDAGSWAARCRDCIVWHLYHENGTGHGAILAHTLKARVHPDDRAAYDAGRLGELNRYALDAGLPVEEDARLSRGQLGFSYMEDSTRGMSTWRAGEGE